MISAVEQEDDGSYYVQVVTPRTWMQEVKAGALSSRRWSRLVRARAAEMGEQTQAVRERLREKWGSD